MFRFRFARAPLLRLVVLTVLTAVLSLVTVGSQPASAQPAPVQVPRVAAVPTASGGIVRGIISTQNGTIPLGGVLVSLTVERTTQVQTVISEGDGSYRFEGLSAGSYRVAATLDGFEPKTVVVKVEYNQTADVSLDLPISGVSETVTVTAPEAVVPSAGTITAAETIGGRELEQLAPGGGF